MAQPLELRPPSGVQQTQTTAVAPRGLVTVDADLVSQRSRPGGFLQLYTSRRSTFSSQAQRVAELDLSRRSYRARGGERRLTVRKKLRLPRGAKGGRRYRLIACTVRSRRARPSAKNCLPSLQRVLIKRTR